MTTHSRFSSRLTTIMTMAGMAIGLGNVWRFPYTMGQNGGSAFLLIYAVFMLLLAVPALSAEWSLGRATRGGPVQALRRALGHRFGTVFGLLLLFSVFIVTCYYTIVVGNVLYSAWFAATSGFSPATMDAYQIGLNQHGLQYFFALLVVAACLLVVHRGLQGGIEKANTIMVPLFGLGSVYMVLVTLNLEGATEHLAAFLKPDFSRAGPDVWFAAMGQVCFSVGLSGTMMVMYGAYLRKDAAIVPTATAACMADLGAAFLAALFVVPAVLVFGLDLAAGPGLLFNTLPSLFGAMPGGRTLAPFFLLGWALVALLTIFAALDTVASSLADLTPGRLSRQAWVWITGLTCAGVILPIAFNPAWIGTLDVVFGSGMFMIGALIAVIALGWGLGAVTTRAQVGPGLGAGLQAAVTGWIRFVVPVALAAILGGFLWSNLAG